VSVNGTYLVNIYKKIKLLQLYYYQRIYFTISEVTKILVYRSLYQFETWK